jgi:Family of unknown function (DUF6064)
VELPFTAEQFYFIFREYNETVWPAQVLLLGLALAASVLLLVPRHWSSVWISIILAVLWGWMAIAYHIAFFSRINPAAYAFSALSLVGALVFLWQGVVRRRLKFTSVGGGRAMIGALFIIFALVAYPAWSAYAGHAYPSVPTFGLPCPTTMFTIGILAFAVSPYPRSPLVVPIVWCVIGTQAALLLGMQPDLVLIVAGVAGAFLFMRSRTTIVGTSAI